MLAIAIPLQPIGITCSNQTKDDHGYLLLSPPKIHVVITCDHRESVVLMPRRIVASDWATSWVSIRAWPKAGVGGPLGPGPLGHLGPLKNILGPRAFVLFDHLPGA